MCTILWTIIRPRIPTIPPGSLYGTCVWYRYMCELILQLWACVFAYHHSRVQQQGHACTCTVECESHVNTCQVSCWLYCIMYIQGVPVHTMYSTSKLYRSTYRMLPARVLAIEYWCTQYNTVRWYYATHWYSQKLGINWLSEWEGLWILIPDKIKHSSKGSLQFVAWEHCETNIQVQVM